MRGKGRGFTLVELLVVIIVLGAIIGLVIPSLGEMTGANLRRSARHLTGVIRFLRDDAQAKKAIYRLRFDVPGNRYWAEVLTITPEGYGEFKHLPSAISTEAGLSGQTELRDIEAGSHPDDPYILFTPDGWVEKAFIHIRDGDGKDYTLIVRPLTGDTDLHEGYVEER